MCSKSQMYHRVLANCAKIDFLAIANLGNKNQNDLWKPSKSPDLCGENLRTLHICWVSHIRGFPRKTMYYEILRKTWSGYNFIWFCWKASISRNNILSQPSESRSFLILFLNPGSPEIYSRAFTFYLDNFGGSFGLYLYETVWLVKLM